MLVRERAVPSQEPLRQWLGVGPRVGASDNVGDYVAGFHWLVAKRGDELVGPAKKRSVVWIMGSMFQWKYNVIFPLRFWVSNSYSAL